MNSPSAMEAFLAKADESLASAAADHASGRYNSSMNRCYYSCFQAAIAALIQAGVAPRGQDDAWSHRFVQSQFNGVLINRRHLYAPSFRDVLPRAFLLRKTADYEPNGVSQIDASRALGRAEAFVHAVATRLGGPL